MKGWLEQEKNRKASLIILILVAVATLFLGIKLLPGRLIRPFNLLPAGSSGISLNSPQDDQQKFLALKSQDTDKDGLSDYDELYVYHTSPYLEDTDSDGFGDKQEIDTGNDPNCPKGKDCQAAAGGLPSTSGSTQENLQNSILSGLSSTAAGNGLGNQTPDLSLLQNFDLTPTQLRELLKQNGFSEDELAKIDDATLKQIWQDSIKNTPPANSSSNTPAPVQPEVKPLTAAELRQMLLGVGLDQKILDNLSDDELLKMYQEIVKKQ